MAFGGLQAIIQHTTTNQKQAYAMDGGMDERCKQSESMGGGLIHPLGSNRVGSVEKNYIKLLSLLIIVFVAKSSDNAKPFHITLGQPLSQRLLGWGS